MNLNDDELIDILDELVWTHSGGEYTSYFEKRETSLKIINGMRDALKLKPSKRRTHSGMRSHILHYARRCLAVFLRRLAYS